MKILPLALATFMGCLAFSGCRDDAITAYRVPKDDSSGVVATATTTTAPPPTAALPAPSVPTSGAKMSDTPVAVGAGRSLVWTAPSSWQAKPLGAMRKGSYTISEPSGATADLSITAFPGAVGGDQANIDRWRGQLGLPPVPIEQLSPALVRISSHGLSLSIVDLTSAPGGEPKRLLGAIVPFDGATWFFKLLGPDAVVAADKSAFLEFLYSVQPATEGKAP